MVTHRQNFKIVDILQWKKGKMKHSFFIEGENERISALLDAQKTFLDDLRRPCELVNSVWPEISTGVVNSS